MKCLPKSQVASAKGIVLHDQHAEILAIRAFNRFLIDECMVAVKGSSKYVSVAATGHARREPFALVDGVKIYLYCSEAPCGDASMELVMQAQDDSTPWEDQTQQSSGSLLGRGHFSQLGIVRRKPGTFLTTSK